MNTKQNRKKDKNWLRNPNQIKNPKIFEAKFMRDKDGKFHLIGGETKVYERKNQHSYELVNVDTRDFVTELRRCGFGCR